MKVNVIMPMLGEGKRMCGVQPTCKPLMFLPDGDRFFLKALSSLKNYDIYSVLLVVRGEYQREFIDYIPDVYLRTKAKMVSVISHAPTQSPVETLKIGFEHIWQINRRNLPLFCLDCDIYGEVPSFIHFPAEVGRLFYFESDNPNKSYLRIHANTDDVYDVCEKKVISKNAIFGAYLFEDVIFLKYCLQRKDLNFQYISDIFKYMLQRKLTIKACPVTNVTNFGTKEELEHYGE